MCEDFLSQFAPLCLIESLVKGKQAAASLETIPGHLQLVHRVDILYVHLDTRPIRCFCSPHVEIFMATSFEIKGVIAVVEVGKFGEKAKVVFRIEF